ncbi:unnamed protein product [Thelazia callipaeda]|uniref:G_PROTEIN_RECEP_F1_2 domain-containing protein n=1 Tax=Thelazia callipaeda TaxID=103827 RepID=A0A0N5DBU2_THECL|nr:unnamed protein product [Thelazia callipaeda]
MADEIWLMLSNDSKTEIWPDVPSENFTNDTSQSNQSIIIPPINQYEYQCRQTMSDTDDQIFTLLPVSSLFISLAFIIASSYLFATVMTEINKGCILLQLRNALLATEDAMLLVMDSVLVCLMPGNLINLICAKSATPTTKKW